METTTYKGKPTPLPCEPSVDGSIIRLIVKRTTGLRGVAFDIMECGHVLLPRAVPLPLNATIGARTCVKCRLGGPVEMESFLKMPRSEMMKHHWAWWYEERKKGPQG